MDSSLNCQIVDTKFCCFLWTWCVKGSFLCVCSQICIVSVWSPSSCSTHLGQRWNVCKHSETWEMGRFQRTCIRPGQSWPSKLSCWPAWTPHCDQVHPNYCKMTSLTTKTRYVRLQWLLNFAYKIKSDNVSCSLLYCKQMVTIKVKITVMDNDSSEILNGYLQPE